MPGSEMLARTASISDPSRSQTSLPVLRSVATAANGTGRFSIIGSERISPQIAGDPLPLDQPRTGDHHIHETDDVRPGKLAHPPVQRIEKPGREGSGDQRADGGAAGDIDRDPRLQQAPDHADVRPSPGGAAAQGNADFFCHNGPYRSLMQMQLRDTITFNDTQCREKLLDEIFETALQYDMTYFG